MGTVKLTGGEPLLHPRIGELIEIVKAEGLRFTMETNGVLCTPELARLMASCKSQFVAVSLDGADPETHEWARGVEGSFSRALSGIRNLVDAGIRPQVIMTVMRRNRGQMESLVCLSESLGAGSVKFNVVQPTARGERMHEDGETLPIGDLIAAGRWVETALAASASIQVFYSHPAAFRPQSRMFAPDGGCGTCGIFGILGVLADGSYALCGIGEQVPELVFGHAARDRLEDVWRESPILHEIREGLPGRLEGICGACLMRRICLGSCVAQNYYIHKRLWGPYWFCEQAERAGVPRTLVPAGAPPIIVTVVTPQGAIAAMDSGTPGTHAPRVRAAGPIVKTGTMPRAAQAGTASTPHAGMGGMPGKRAATAGWPAQGVLQGLPGEVNLFRQSC